MKNKKIVLLVLFIFILTALVACSSGESETSTADSSSSSAVASSKAPAESSKAPAESSKAPAESSKAPAESSKAPAESSKAPAESSKAPAESSKAPAESSGAPAESSKAPAESSSAPAESSNAPAESSKAPAESSKAPAESSVVSKPEENVITVKEALDIAAGLADKEVTTERYYIRANVVTVSNAVYGEMTIADETGEIYVYGSYSADGITGYAAMADKPYQGAEVYISALIQNYNGKAELKSVWIQSFKNIDPQIDESVYTEMTVDAARKAAAGSQIKITGVVAQITYANGKIPSGFILVDGTNAIYVYDGQIAPRVAVGNTVTVLGDKTWWILGSEQNNAGKFGYQGCCQLEKAYLKSNDGKTTAFNTSWISETTVKNIMETPVTEDITTTIFKVTALVKRAPGDGFTNYYIDDLDGTTGSYCYSQCNGADFAWLDEFDGKICTVYLTVINAKSTGTGCLWRFLPVKVVDEGFTFNPANAGKFAVDYYALSQFTGLYAADPAKELLTSVSSELLGLDNIKLSYASDNEKVAYIDENNVFHAKGNGTATITITATYGDQTPYSATVTVTVEAAEEYEYISVAEAIAAPVSTTETITVKGVVASSLVNQQGGFYLIDDTGVIAVKFATATDIEGISIGDEIIITGHRDAYSQKNGYPGQTCITGATLVVNLYGSKEYSTATFVTDKTMSDVYELINETQTTDYTTTVFVAEAKITCTAGGYSTNYYLVDPTNEANKITLYAGSGAQYAFLAQYVDQVVKVEFALCNWNAKNPYKACVLAVYNEDGTKVINSLNFAD